MAWGDTGLLAQAEAEIERLRAALKQIADCDPYLELDCKLAAIARSALNQQRTPEAAK